MGHSDQRVNLKMYRYIMTNTYACSNMMMMNTSSPGTSINNLQCTGMVATHGLSNTAWFWSQGRQIQVLSERWDKIP